ncbi:MAG: prepilin-type N-terminal cleavage/methylation domain-containing protein [Desulfuromonadales bacterium]|nr:prepilin-type N-terminal cleavage/methylation domain-containing protein [Desulfuromonadales bacterium]
MCVTSSNKGFTLLEILIAVVLLGILSAALYGSYFTVLRARETVFEGMEARRELGSTLDRIRREFAAAPSINVNNRDDKRLRFIVEDRDNFGKPASTLELTTLVSAAGAGRKESGVSAVRYRLVEKDKRYILMKREQDVFFESPDAKEYPQMERISSFLVECYDGSKWVKSWDTAQALNGALPKMLRITVQVEENGKPAEFSVLSRSMVTGL